MSRPRELLATKDSNCHGLRYPYLREGDTVEKRRAVRAYLQAHRYRLAQVTLDREDDLWNSNMRGARERRKRRRWCGCDRAI
jgi:hypothetical protein